MDTIFADDEILARPLSVAEAYTAQVNLVALYGWGPNTENMANKTPVEIHEKWPSFKPEAIARAAGRIK
jgi:hypothetical protein